MKYKDFYRNILKEDSVDDHNKHMDRAENVFRNFLDDRRSKAPGKTHQEKNDWLWKNDPQYAKIANELFALKRKYHHPDTQKMKFDNDSYYIRFGDFPKEGKSYNFLYKYYEKGESVIVLEVVCPSTQRLYHLYPPNQKAKTCLEAKESTFHDKKLSYRHGDVGLFDSHGDGILTLPLVET